MSRGAPTQELTTVTAPPRLRGDGPVAACLRSDAPLVVVEAPAGCGKTHQGSLYAAEAVRGRRGRVLVLTHTHAAASAFVSRAEQESARVDVRTIDSLIVEMAAAYHQVLGLPEDVGKWASQEKGGFGTVAGLLAKLLNASATPGRALAMRYPVVVFDEHQDASAAQGALLDALVRAGARVRAFGDPMQTIYPDTDVETCWARWEELCNRASMVADLDRPHRWENGSRELGEWVLAAREALKNGSPIDLRGRLPRGVEIYRAENTSPRRDGYRTSNSDGRPIRRLVDSEEILFLSAHNSTVRALRPYFNRRVPVWEGHTRDALGELVRQLEAGVGDPCAIAEAFMGFVQDVAVGFSKSAFGDRLIQEVREGCSRKTSGMPAKLQHLARCLLASPDHRGVAECLESLRALVQDDRAFRGVELDHRQEFWDAIRLGEFDDVAEGLAQLQQRRTWTRPSIPPRALSTIHKAKGLEAPCVTIIPCDARHFRDRLKDRCTLYVALSRARERLCLVVPRQNPTPLFLVD